MPCVCRRSRLCVWFGVAGQGLASARCQGLANENPEQKLRLSTMLQFMWLTTIVVEDLAPHVPRWRAEHVTHVDAVYGGEVARRALPVGLVTSPNRVCAERGLQGEALRVEILCVRIDYGRVRGRREPCAPGSLMASENLP